MTQIYPGRFTAVTDEPFVLFLVGMRVNKLTAVNKWLPVARAMPPMLATLFTYPEKGFLGGHNFLGWRMTLLMTYWRSFADLETFARNPSDPHLAAWKRFNQAVGADGSVGIWHETYQIEPQQFESVYGNMPRFGLGAVMEHMPATGRRHTARQRLNGPMENKQAASRPEEMVR